MSSGADIESCDGGVVHGMPHRAEGRWCTTIYQHRACLVQSPSRRRVCPTPRSAPHRLPSVPRFATCSRFAVVDRRCFSLRRAICPVSLWRSSRRPKRLDCIGGLGGGGGGDGGHVFPNHVLSLV